MSTESLATPIKSSDQPVGDVGLRNSLLDALTVSSGAIDAISFLGLGKIFTAFMTGNIAFLGMALAGSPTAPRVAAVLSSMAGFGLGIFIATKIVSSGQKPSSTVWPLETTVALGFSLIAHLAFNVIWFVNGAQPGDAVIPILLAVWALAMGMQSAAVRRLEVGGIFTTAATATFIFLFSDLANFRMKGDERRRMRGILLSLAIGATGGAYLLLHAPLYAPALPLVVTALVVLTAGRAFARSQS